MQVHYNLLVGDKPVTNKIVVRAVPPSTPLLPLKLDLSFAAPDLPCPSGVSWPAVQSCRIPRPPRSRVRPDCHGDRQRSRGGVRPQSLRPTGGRYDVMHVSRDASGYIVRAQAHMHLLRRASSCVESWYARGRDILNVPNYNFHYQKAYNLAKPVHVKAGEPLQVRAPTTRLLLRNSPLRKAPPHFVTWGDGSTDEMCLGLSWISATLPNPHASSDSVAR